MSYPLFKVIHLLGVFAILTSMGGLIVLGTADEETRSRWRKLAGLTSGIGLLLTLMGGFGLLGILKISFVWPGWVFSKMVIWLILGGSVSMALRLPQLSMPLWWGSILLAGIAAYLANFKPF